jgi:hypothetical protein
MDTHILKTCKVLIIRVWDSLDEKVPLRTRPHACHTRARARPPTDDDNASAAARRREGNITSLTATSTEWTPRW